MERVQERRPNLNEVVVEREEEELESLTQTWDREEDHKITTTDGDTLAIKLPHSSFDQLINHQPKMETEVEILSQF
jgi:hypothetical protein